MGPDLAGAEAVRFGHFARAEDSDSADLRASLPEAQWQQIWFLALQQPWSSLVLVPAHPGFSALFVAEALADVGRLHGHRPVKLLNAERLDLPDIARVLGPLAALTSREERAVVAAECPLARAASIPIARAADVAVLVVPLGEGRFSDARRAMELVGRDRFVGAITVEPRKR